MALAGGPLEIAVDMPDAGVLQCLKTVQMVDAGTPRKGPPVRIIGYRLQPVCRHQVHLRLGQLDIQAAHGVDDDRQALEIDPHVLGDFQAEIVPDHPELHIVAAVRVGRVQLAPVVLAVLVGVPPRQ